MGTGREGQLVMALWFRISRNVLCLWNDASRGHVRLLDLCPESEIASLSIETETCDGCGSEGEVVMNCWKTTTQADR